MLAFFKSKAGVFVIALMLLGMSLGMLALARNKKPAPVAPPPPKEEKPVAVNRADTMPDIIAQTNSTVEQAKHRTVQDPAQNITGVPIVHRAIPARAGEGSGQYNGQLQPDLKEGRAPGGAPNPNSPEANYHEGLRLSPLPRRQAQPGAADGTSTAPRPAQNPDATATVDRGQGTGTNPTPADVARYMQKQVADATLGGLLPSADSKQRFAPFGRMIKCELVITIDSTNEQTPVVALVVEDQYWNGELIIPAGTEAHGTARVDRERDRIFSGNRWVLVMPQQGKATNGRELVLTGEALDRADPTGTNKTWGITDGSYGLAGDVLKSSDLNDIKLFASTFLATAASAMQATNATAFGTVTPQATAKNGALAGTQAMLNQYSSMLMDQIKKNGSFIRVPAGKQFYLYVTETLMPDSAAVAASAGMKQNAKRNQIRQGTETPEMPQ